MIPNKTGIWLYGMRALSVGILITLRLFLLTNGGIGAVFSLESIKFSFANEEFVGYGVGQVIILILCIIMLISGALGLVAKTLKLCTILAILMLMLATASSGCMYYINGVDRSFDLVILRCQIIIILLTILQLLCLYKIKKQRASVKREKINE